MPYKELVGATVGRQGRTSLLTSRLTGLHAVQQLIGTTQAARERWQNIVRTLQGRDRTRLSNTADQRRHDSVTYSPLQGEGWERDEMS
jgi:hypothetical protein